MLQHVQRRETKHWLSAFRARGRKPERANALMPPRARAVASCSQPGAVAAAGLQAPTGIGSLFLIDDGFSTCVTF